MTEAPICPVTGQAMMRGARPLEVKFKGRTAEVMMPGWYCDESGESVFTREDMRVSDRAIVTLKAEAANLATPDEVRRVRISLGLSQAEAGRLLGGGVRAFQKYESGETMTSRAITNLLRSTERHPDDVELFRRDVSAAQDASVVEEERLYA